MYIGVCTAVKYGNEGKGYIIDDGFKLVLRLLVVLNVKGCLALCGGGLVGVGTFEDNQR